MSATTKLLGAATVVVSGVLSLGLATPAFAAVGVTAGTSTSAGGSTAGQGASPGCSKAAIRLARLDKVQTRIAAALPKLEAAESKAQSNGHPKLAARLARRVSRLERRQEQAKDRSTRIEQRCPGVSPSAGGSSSS